MFRFFGWAILSPQHQNKMFIDYNKWAKKDADKAYFVGRDNGIDFGKFVMWHTIEKGINPMTRAVSEEYLQDVKPAGVSDELLDSSVQGRR